MSERLPLFPLGATLLPGQVLPLHVFEQRYRTLVDHLVPVGTDAGELRRALLEPGRRGPRFGVVAIRRGHEVGSARLQALHAVGCVAEVLRVQRHPDGTSDLVAVGRERFRLDRLDGEAGTPYLTGVVEWLDEPAATAPPELVRAVRALLDRYTATIGASVREGGPLADLDDLTDLGDLGDGSDDDARDVAAQGDQDPERPTGALAEVLDEALADLSADDEDAGAADAAERAAASALDDPTVLSWVVAGAVVLHAGERQELLEAPDAGTRLRLAGRMLRRELLLLDVAPSVPANDLVRVAPDPR